MKAMILAAGVGERMRPLTDHTPKPLLKVGGAALIEHHLRSLSAAGVREVVINVSHLAEQIEAWCGTGQRWGLSIEYSREQTPLETAGGIHRALPLLGDAPFLVVNGDVWTDYPFAASLAWRLRSHEQARLLFVGNPPQHPLGDFLLDSEGWVGLRDADQPGVTYAGIGLYAPSFFAAMRPCKMPLRPLLDASIAQRSLGGEFYNGVWEDVGTPQRLRALDAALCDAR
ncbi:MAG: nucleotidyltransferase family protein [Gammaproteobacteria bacterium]|nr:nucleotidyltransferase family protein [Gammaproteobacteria bacterium]